MTSPPEAQAEAAAIVLSLVDTLISFVESQKTPTHPEAIPRADLGLQQLSLREEKEFLSGEMRVLGEVLHFTEGMLVVRSFPATPLLNLGSQVCGDDGLLIGVVDDVLGTVEHPHYSIQAYHRLPDGAKVFYAVETAKYLHNVTHTPGTDASNMRDEEAVVSSDSEEEAAPPVQLSFQILQRPPARLD